MRNQLLLLLASFVFGITSAFAQSVSGKVTDGSYGEGLPGVAVVVEGSNTGVMSDMDGNYRIQAATGDVLTFSFVGYNTVRKEVTGAAMDVSLESGVALDEVVVTALGVSREKKALGYSVQELGNDAFTDAKTENVVRSLTLSLIHI